MNFDNIPEDAFNYEFIVATKVNDELIYIGAFANGQEAEQLALCYSGGFIIHNVRIQGYRAPKTYTITGKWTWTCGARTKEEAWKQFDDSLFDTHELEAYGFSFDFDSAKITEE